MLDLDLGAVRFALSRAMVEIEGPTELSVAVAWLANAAVRATGMDYWMRKVRERGE